MAHPVPPILILFFSVSPSTFCWKITPHNTTISFSNFVIFYALSHIASTEKASISSNCCSCYVTAAEPSEESATCRLPHTWPHRRPRLVSVTVIDMGESMPKFPFSFNEHGQFYPSHGWLLYCQYAISRTLANAFLIRAPYTQFGLLVVSKMHP